MPAQWPSRDMTEISAALGNLFRYGVLQIRHNCRWFIDWHLNSVNLIWCYTFLKVATVLKVSLLCFVDMTDFQVLLPTFYERFSIYVRFFFRFLLAVSIYFIIMSIVAVTIFIYWELAIKMPDIIKSFTIKCKCIIHDLLGSMLY